MSAGVASLPRRPRRPRLRGRASLGLRFLLLACGAVVVVVPFVYALLAVGKTPAEVLAVPMRWLPQHMLWANFTVPFEKTSFARYFLNSAGVGVAVTLLNLVTCPIAGYAFAKLPFPGRGATFLVVLATLMVPLEVIYVPLYDLIFKLGWNDSYLGLIVPAGTSAFGIFLMRQTAMAIPDELLDAARIDGASEWRIYAQIVMPLLGPSMAVLAIFIFMNNWDSLLWPLLVASDDSLWTLPIGLSAMQDNFGGSFSMLMAAAVEASVPTLVVYFVLQRYFVAGIAMAAGIRG
jgi:ABC-type glycerol-3-phosphate transport system permease component